jgi:hypothetical protein
VQDHPKDVEFINCPIRFYTEMEAIFGHSMATGKFVVGFGEALGAPIKTEGVGETIEIRDGNGCPQPANPWVFAPLGHEHGSVSRPMGLSMG